MTPPDIVSASEIHGNQAVVVSITVMLCYELEPTGVTRRKTKWLIMSRLAFSLWQLLRVLSNLGTSRFSGLLFLMDSIRYCRR